MSKITYTSLEQHGHLRMIENRLKTLEEPFVVSFKGWATRKCGDISRVAERQNIAANDLRTPLAKGSIRTMGVRYSPIALLTLDVQPLQSESWGDYMARTTGIIEDSPSYEWLFAPWWETLDSRPIACAARINFYLEGSFKDDFFLLKNRPELRTASHVMTQEYLTTETPAVQTNSAPDVVIDTYMVRVIERASIKSVRFDGVDFDGVTSSVPTEFGEDTLENRRRLWLELGAELGIFN